MSERAFHTYLLFVAALTAILGVVNMVRPAKRWLGAGAVALSVAALLFAEGLPLFAVAVPGALALLCMAKDFSARVGKSPGRGA